MPMEQRVAIVTGGVRGLGRAMTFGLAREGHKVLAIGHIDADVGEVEAATAGSNFAGQILPLVADLRQPADCDRVVPMALSRFGGVHILVNNAGLTFTTIDPARFRRAEPQKFWQVPDQIVRAVIETNYLAADQMARRSAPLMVEQGWGASSIRACSAWQIFVEHQVPDHHDAAAGEVEMVHGPPRELEVSTFCRQCPTRLP